VGVDVGTRFIPGTAIVSEFVIVDRRIKGNGMVSELANGMVFSMPVAWHSIRRQAQQMETISIHNFFFIQHLPLDKPSA
jgi:hypothetical protein